MIIMGGALIRVPAGQGKTGKVREFEWSGKVWYWYWSL